MAYSREVALIYALCCPDTGRVRYIGKANDARKRLNSHIRDSGRRNTPVYCWIRSLRDRGAMPELRVLASTWDWPSTERAIIAQYRSEDHLLNLADGGDEPKITREQRVKNGLQTIRQGFVAKGAIITRESLIIATHEWLLRKGRQWAINGLIEIAKKGMREHYRADPATFKRWASV